MRIGLTRRALAILTAILGGASLAGAAGDLMQAGKWEITSSTEIEGMAHHMPPRTFTQCVKPEDVKDPHKMVQQSQEQRDNCEMKDLKVEGSKVTWSVECRGKNAVKGTGTMVYGSGTYEGTINLEMSGSDRGPMKMTTHLKGRRLGDCP
jgi:hypothetical protein